uniref:Retrovirus-related Pol polyprotein from transposon TNT 1-94 n=1 Tax=Tanacetum cinerariifolium TaxID=118510 RepID=A0A6L2J943_TANCI|nr:retrovirus-related Pol polyprotein from transposon TNT 1-94 [Tanacetum cinerariifolium]
MAIPLQPRLTYQYVTNPNVTNPNIINIVNDPLYIASSAHPGMVLTNTPFNGSNFHGWSRNVKMALGAKLKLGFIDGSCTKPQVDDVDKQVTNHVFEPTAFFANMNNKGGNSGRRDVKNGKKAKKSRRMAAHVNSGFDEHFHGDTPFDMESENKIGFEKWWGRSEVVAAVCQEIMKMFKGKGIMEDKNYACTSHADGKLIQTNNLTTHFYPKDFMFQDPSTKKIVAVGKGSRCLYIYKPTTNQVTFFNSVSEFSNSHKQFSPTVCFNKNAYSNYVYKQSVDVHIFHAWFGHIAVSKLIYIPVCNSMDLSKFSCECCMLSKSHRLPFQLSNSMSKNAIELLHIDLWGPYKQSALNGAHYFFTIVDDHTRATWTYLVHTKNQIPVVITSFLAYVEIHFQTKPKFIRSDNRTKIVNSECATVYQQKGILHQSSIDFKGIPQSHIVFLANAFPTSDPTTFYQASSDSGWIEAMNKELVDLESNITWTLTSLPSGHIHISSKWVYKTKYHPDGSEERKKARLVVRGFNQKEGLDYKHTFSPVAKLAIVRVLVALAAAKQWPLHQLDVNNTFLHGYIDEEIYMLPPQVYNKDAKCQVCKLKRSLYGLKQASRQWNHELTKFLTSLGYEQSKLDYSLFVKNNKASFTAALVYVDDVLITGNSEEEIINLT